MREKVEEVLKKLNGGQLGATIGLLGIDDGIVTVEVYTSSCGALITKDLAVEVIEDELKVAVPEIKEVVAV